MQCRELGRGLTMLKTVAAKPQADEAAKQALREGAAAAIVQCHELMSVLAGGVTHQLIELGGGAQSLDYWTFSTALEVACLACKPWEQLVPSLVRCVRRAPYPETLKVTGMRLAAIASSYKLQAEYDDDTGLDMESAAVVAEDAAELLKESMSFKLGASSALDEFIDELESSATSPSLRMFRTGNGPTPRRQTSNRRASKVVTVFRTGSSPLTSQKWKRHAVDRYVDFFLTGTFNFRGLVGSARLRFLPGGLSLVGARVPDMIFSRADERNFGQLLYGWGLEPTIESPSSAATTPTPTTSNGGGDGGNGGNGGTRASTAPPPPDGHEAFSPDTRQFVADVTRRVRAAFSTWLLQDLHSAEHAKFDASSQALIELMGISMELRRGVNATSNASLSLLFFGDCREHASEMSLFFSFRQMLLVSGHCQRVSEKLLGPLTRASQHAERLARDVASGLMTKGMVLPAPPPLPSLPPLPADDLERAARHMAQCASVLKEELRGGHVGVYAEVAMVEQYLEAHPPSGATTAQGESVTDLPMLRQWAPGEALTPYELGKSFMLLTYEDGSRLLLDSNLQSNWQLPHDEKGVPHWPTAHPESGSPLLPFKPSQQAGSATTGPSSGVRLFNLIEEHTMTFLFRHATAEAPAAIARADAFYNELCSAEERGTDGTPRPRKFMSPYAFGSGAIALSEGSVQCVKWLGGQVEDGAAEWRVLAPPSAAHILLDGGTLEAASAVHQPVANGQRPPQLDLDEEAAGGTYDVVRTPVWLRPCGFSRRSDAPALSELGQSLSMIGRDLGQVDVALELAREDAEHGLNLPSRRDMFIERLIHWHKAHERAKRQGRVI